jgi:hypothetical protein
MAFTKGHSGNPYGRPVAPRGELNDAFIEAIKQVEKNKKKNILAHFVERALLDDTVLINLMRKLLPDLKSLDALIGVIEDRMAPDEAAKIRESLRRNMGTLKDEITDTQKVEEEKSRRKTKTKTSG